MQRDGACASMAAIAAEAGITKPILYRHFGDKSGLYAALAERHTDRLLDALVDALTGGGTPRERVHRTIDTYLATIEAEPQVYRFLVQSEEAVAAPTGRCAASCAGCRSCSPPASPTSSGPRGRRPAHVRVGCRDRGHGAGRG